MAELKQRSRKVVTLALRQLLRFVREYPREPLLGAVREACRYGLYDLDRLERRYDAINAFELLSVRRKQKPFVDDPRGIGRWEVRLIDDIHWNVYCQAHVPEALRKAYADQLPAG